MLSAWRLAESVEKVVAMSSLYEQQRALLSALIQTF
jgi:hypothetical protein